MKKIIDRNVPACLINVLIDWCCKIYASVRWNGVVSAKFYISFGDRLGSVLSSFFLANMLMIKMQN